MYCTCTCIIAQIEPWVVVGFLRFWHLKSLMEVLLGLSAKMRCHITNSNMCASLSGGINLKIILLLTYHSIWVHGRWRLQSSKGWAMMSARSSRRVLQLLLRLSSPEIHGGAEGGGKGEASCGIKSSSKIRVHSQIVWKMQWADRWKQEEPSD